MIVQIVKLFGASESELPRLLRNAIGNGRIVSSKIKKANGREDCERIYECNDECPLLRGMGLNDFPVIAYPQKNGKVQ